MEAQPCVRRFVEFEACAFEFEACALSLTRVL